MLKAGLHPFEQFPMQLGNSFRIKFRIVVVSQQTVDLLLDVCELCVAESGQKLQ